MRNGLGGEVFADIIKGYAPDTESHRRGRIAEKDKAYDLIRQKPVAETTADDFKAVLRTGTVSTNVYLRRVQNYAQGMNWLMMPILPKKLFPKPNYAPKRAITQFEHERIITREGNPERRSYYELLWCTGGSQGDIAKLHAEDVDSETRIISFQRRKTRRHELQPVSFKYGSAVEALLKGLSRGAGPLFPNLSKVRSCDRATEFGQRCVGLDIAGITLHSYRYAWAERAKTCGYPERYAMVNLGHNSKAVHRAYSKNVAVEIPSLEEFEIRL